MLHRIAFPVVSEWCQYRPCRPLLRSTPAPQDKQPPRAEDGRKRREEDTDRRDRRLVGIERAERQYQVRYPLAPRSDGGSRAYHDQTYVTDRSCPTTVQAQYGEKRLRDDTSEPGGQRCARAFEEFRGCVSSDEDTRQ